MVYITYYFIGIFSTMFLATSISKLIQWNKHLAVLNAYELVKGPTVKYLLFLFVMCEVFIGLSLLIIGFTVLNTIITTLLLSIYSIAVGINIYRGNTNISCGCGSVLENDHLSLAILYRNGFLIFCNVLICIYAKYSNLTLPIHRSIPIFLLSLASIILYGITKKIIESIHLTRRLRNKLS